MILPITLFFIPYGSTSFVYNQFFLYSNTFINLHARKTTKESYS